ncbi:MAG: PAC2 family protein, partial [Acidimicrobiia bacterium]
MAMYDLTDPGPLRSPALVVAFEGWVNAGSAGTIAAETLAGEGAVIARFDPDGLYDYRVNRPVIDFVDGAIDTVEWPRMELRHSAMPERDVLVLTGTEPNWNWRRFSAEVAEVEKRLGVVEHVSIGGIPWAAAHTRPVSIMTTASSVDRLPDGDDPPRGLLRVPGAAVSVVESAAVEADIPSVGFWARVPHYLGASFAAAALALVERVVAHLGVTTDLTGLATTAADQ